MFRKFAVVLTAAVVCLVSVGCYSVKITAPADNEVKLIPLAKQTSFKKSVRSWYVLWGLVPLSNADDGVSKVIKANGLSEVRLVTKATFLDGLLTAILMNGLVGTYTTIVEGNTGGGGSSSSSGFDSAPNYGSGSDSSSSDSDSEDSSSEE